MNPDKQRIAIAEACGWKVSPSIKGPYDGCPCGTLPPLRSITPLPDYLNDLNAMHEAEKVLTNAQHETFCAVILHLTAATEQTPYPPLDWNTVRCMMRATAAQRAEAFLRTIGAWVDEPKARQRWEEA